MNALPKKERLRLRRELEKLQRTLGGVANMERVPDAMFIIDVNVEHLAVAEATRLEIPVVSLVDTNCDPDPIDIVIPGNDDAIRAAQLIAGDIAEAARAGRELARAKRQKGDDGPADTAIEEVAPVEDAAAAAAE